MVVRECVWGGVCDGGEGVCVYERKRKNAHNLSAKILESMNALEKQ